MLREEKTQNLLDKIRGKQVLVVGDLVLDHYLEGIVTRISPEAPVPVLELGDNCDRKIPGGAANVALNVLALGGKPIIAGVIGDDSAGHILSSLLEKAGVNTDCVVVDKSRPTTEKTRVVSKTHQLLRIDKEKTHIVSLPVKNELTDRISSLPKVDAIILEDYDKGVFSPELIAFLVEYSVRCGIHLSVDPKVRNFWQYNHCNLFKPNRHEAGKALGIIIDSVEKAIEAGEKIQKRLSCDVVHLTLGSNGSVLVYKKEDGIKHKHIPTVAQHVFDVSGAGDSVISVLGLACCSMIPIEEAAELANLAAAAVCSEPGVYAVKPEDIIERCTNFEST